MIAFYGYILRLLDIVDALQNGQSVTHAGDAHRFEVIMQQGHQSFANNFIF